MYILQALKTKLFPSLDDVKSAIQKADEPDEKARDVRPLMAILSRISIASPRLAGHILTRKTAMTSFNWVITTQDKAGQARIDAMTTRLAPVINKIFETFYKLPFFGTYCMELNWESNETEIVPSVKKEYLPIDLEKSEQGLNIIESLDNGSYKRTPVSSLPQNTFVYAQDNNYWIGGILRSIIYHEILRNDTIQEWANFNKKLKGVIQALAEMAEQKNAADALTNMAKNNFAVTSKDVEFKFNTMADYKGLDSFPKFLEKLESDIAIASLGQANSTELPNNGGSRAALQVLNLIRNDILLADLLAGKSLINDQLLVYDYQFNVDKNAESSPYKLDFVFDDNEDIETNARMLETLSRVNLPLIKSEVYQKVGMTVPTAEDETITLQAPSLPGF